MDTTIPLVTPSAAYPPPTQEELAALRTLGPEFQVDGAPQQLPVDPTKVSQRTMAPGGRLGRFVRVGSSGTGVDEIEAVSDPAKTGTRGERATGGVEAKPGDPALCVVPIGRLDAPALRALAYAAELHQPILAVHLVPDKDAEEHFLEAWRAFGEPVRLEILRSPYRAIVAPLAQYLLGLHGERPDLIMTVVLPEIVPRRAWERLLHGRVTARLRKTLHREPGIVLTSVPFAV